jgi:hypothetical protein
VVIPSGCRFVVVTLTNFDFANTGYAIGWTATFMDACRITDTFSRIVPVTSHASNGSLVGQFIGAADAGPTWNVELAGGLDMSVDGAQLVARSYKTGSVVPGGFSIRLPTNQPKEVNTKTIRFRMSDVVSTVDPGDGDALTISFGAFTTGPYGQIRVNPSGQFFQSSYLTNTAGAAVSIPNAYWQAGVWYTISLVDDGTQMTVEISDGTTTYMAQGPSNSATVTNQPFLTIQRNVNLIGGTHPDISINVDDLEVPEVNSCP